MLISFYIRKEAVLSSQIEGTQSTLTELLLFEIAPETGTEDTLDVSNYVQAMRHGLKRMQEGFPLSLRLIREMHSILLQTGRGSRSTPGNSGLRRIGLAGRDRAMLFMFPRQSSR